MDVAADSQFVLSETCTIGILFPLLHGAECLDRCPSYPRSEAWKERCSNDLVFLVLHYHYVVFMAMTPRLCWYQRRRKQKRATEAEVLPQHQGTQHAVLSMTKHYLINIFFCRNIIHVGKKSYKNMCFSSASQVASPLLHPTFMRTWDRNTDMLTITHAFIWRSRNAIFSFGMS